MTVLLALLTCAALAAVQFPAHAAAAATQTAAANQTTDISECSFPPRGGGNGSLPECPEVSTPTTEEAKASAWKWAPIVHMHPLEPYHLQDPTVFWEAATLVDAYNEVKDPNDTLVASGADFNDYYLLSRSYITVTNATDKDEILRGAPVNKTTGLSSAKVFYSVFDVDGKYFAYNYNLFYSFNGCSNQILALALNGQYQDTRYILCPAGIHEGDWERVTVLLCKREQRVRRVVLSQHGWNQHLDCDAGECTFEGTHPVVYAALNSHANYPAPSPAWVYAEVRLNFLPNLDGVYIIDRTLTGPEPGPRFVPTPENIVYLETDPNDASLNRELWGLYLGIWGAPQQKQPYTITCLNTAQTQYVSCPNNTATSKLVEVLDRLNGGSGNVTSGTGVVADAGTSLISSTITRVFTADGSAPPGPITRDYTYYWSPPAPAPLYTGQSGVLAFLTNRTAPPVCPISGDPSSSLTVPVYWKADDLEAYLIGIAVGVIVFALLMTLVLLVPPMVQPSVAAITLVPAVDRASFPSPHEDTRLRAVVVPVEHAIRIVWVVLALILYISGAVLVGLGCESLWNTLSDLLSIHLWNTLRGIFIALLTIVGVFDLVFAIVLATMHPLKLCALFQRCLPERVKDPAARARKRGNVTSALMTGCILVVISVVILLFGFGVTITVFRKIFAKACRAVVSRAVNTVGNNDYCINLRQFGLDRVYCLADVARFCNRWELLRVNFIVLGSVFMLWAHLMFLLLVGRNFALTREYRLRSEWSARSSVEAGSDSEDVIQRAKGIDVEG